MTQMNLFTKQKIESQMQKTNLWLPPAKEGEGYIGRLGLTCVCVCVCAVTSVVSDSLSPHGL